MYRRALAGTALAFTLALPLGACTAATPNPPAASTTAGNANGADLMFATMMVPHHQQAIEMSDILLAKADADGKVRGLAERIKAAQGPEITQLQGWLKDWAAASSAPGGHGGHGGGMMSPEDLTKLREAAGPQASTLFLQQMIAHHEGAVTMARAEEQGGKNPEAIALARRIIESQTAEIAEMKQLLAGS